MALLSVSGLTCQFNTREGVFTAVEDVSFEVPAGSVTAIVGESGSGKSVTCYSLLGLIPSPPGKVVAGEAKFNGKNLLAMSESELQKVRGNRIGMIFQDPMTSLNPNMTIAKQLVEPLLVHRSVSKAEARQKAIAALEDVGIRNAKERIDSYPHEFSGGMRQRVMIAMALINEPDLLIADEPTTALDVTIQAQILTLVQKLQKTKNLAVIFISHDLAVVGNLADHILVMKEGRVVEQGPPKVLFEQPKHEYTKALLSAVPTSAKPMPSQVPIDAAPFLKVRHLQKHFVKTSGIFKKRVDSVHAVKDVSLEVKPGEIVGLVGESGSGKSTIGRCIMQLHTSDSGSITLAGEELTQLPAGALREARRSFQMVFQDPYASLNPRMTVFDCIAEPLRIHKIVPPGELVERVNTLMDHVGLARNVIRKYPHEFSGGQRQRIAIARALAMEPKLIIADEPVSALDVTIQAQILDLLLELSSKFELSMLFISHDLSVVRYISDRVAVLQQGAIVEQGPTEEIFNNPEHPYTKALIGAVPHASWAV